MSAATHDHETDPEAEDVLAHILELTAAERHREALAVLDATPAGALSAGAAQVARAHAFAGLERYRQAHELLGRALGGQDLDEPLRLRAQVLDARVLRRASPLVDDALETALAAARTATRLAEDDPDDDEAAEIAVLARLEAAQLYARKRCPVLARGELEAAARLGPGDPRVAFNEGHLAALFDDRAAARAKFEAVLAAGTPEARRLGHLGLAHVATLMGEFGRAHGHLNSIAEVSPDDIYPRRLRVRLLMSEQRWEPVAAELAEILAASPDGDYAASDRFERGSALWRAGQAEPARAAWREIVAAGPAEGWVTKRARRALELVGRPPSPERRKRRLAEFPSVAQLRDHCGPASVELYLGYFGLTAEQVEVARAIKNPEGGTPVYRMRKYLDAAGFVTRRVEAELPQLRNLIDAGIPVIMEEDYSDSRHVAVAIGYDDEREILEVQDPMSHEVRETPYEDLAGLRNLSNHGALVGVPKSDARRVAALDAAGAAECRYIAAIDEAWAAKDAGKPEDGDRLADESVGLRKDYELAWLYKFYRARDVAQASNKPDDAKRLYATMDEILALWPDDEWPQQLLGELKYFAGDYQAAQAAFTKARDRDPGDAHNWSWIADCLLAMNRGDEAIDALEQTLRRNPGHRRGNENLAHQMWRVNRPARAWILNAVARELAPKNPFNHGIHASLLADQGDQAGAVAAYERALAIDPARRGYLIERAKLLAKLGKVDEAAASLAEACAKREDLGLRIELADLLYHAGRHVDAAAAAKKILELDGKAAAGHAILGAALAQAGDLEQGLAAMRAALELWPSYAWVYVQMGKALGAAGKPIDAVAARAAAFGLTGRAEHQLGLARALAAAGQANDAERNAQQAARSGGLGPEHLDEVVDLLVELGRGGAASHLFEHLGQRFPERVDIFRAHARLLLEVLWAPGLAEAPLARLRELAPNDPWALAARGGDLMDESLAGEVEGEALLRQAIATAPARVYPRRTLAARLRARGRFAEALEVLAPLPSDYPTDHERVQALLGAGKTAEADSLAAAFEKARAQPGRALPGAMILRYRIARHTGDLEGALALAEQIAREYHEKDDDGRLDPWEEEKFACLVRLGELERARHFGERQAQDAASLATLAQTALSAGAAELAGVLAERALRLDADQAVALHVEARRAELGGDVAGAEKLWRRVGELVDWHAWHEELARLLIGTGQLAEAHAHAEAAVAGGHTCPWPFAARAQLRFLAGDADGARADLERAWALASPDGARQDAHDVWALRALLAGDAAGAAQKFATYLREDAPISPADRARVARLREGRS